MEIRSVPGFLTYLERIRARTRAVVVCIPEDDLEWRYTGGMFSFGDLVRHIGAIERDMFAENVAGRTSRYAGCGRELADGFELVLAYFDRTHAETLGIIGGLSDADLLGRCTTPGGAEIAVWKWLRAMVEHEIHHRGQLYTYMAMRGHPAPTLFGLTEPQVRARGR